MSDRLILPGHSPDSEQVAVEHTETVLGPDGVLYAMRVTGTAELVRGPLGQFLDLRDRLGREAVPPELNDVLDRLNES